MADKSKLEKMVDDIIDGKTEQAQTNFHGYLKDKMAEVIAPTDTDQDLEELNKE